MSMRIEDIAQQALAKLGFKDSSIYRISDPGSSKSRVFLYKVQDDRMVAVKILSCRSAARVTLSSELNNRKKIADFIDSRLADVYWYGEIDEHEVIVYEAIGTDSLHGEVLRGTLSQCEVEDIWTEFIITMTSMWSSSVQEPPARSPRPYRERMRRIEDGLTKYFSNFYSDRATSVPMIVNGKRYPSLRALIATLQVEPQQQVSVTCHGDPQPSNIIIDRKRGDWRLIDWEWSGAGHDWRMMAAHMYGWWLTRTTRLASSPEMDFDGEFLRINYNAIDNTMNDSIRAATLETIQQHMQASTQDIDALKHYLALLVLGEVRFAHIWGREAYIPYLIGMAHEILSSPLETNVAFRREQRGAAV